MKIHPPASPPTQENLPLPSPSQRVEQIIAPLSTTLVDLFRLRWQLDMEAQSMVSDLYTQEMCDANHNFYMSEAAFWNMLVDVVGQSDFVPPVGRPTKVLNIGCGKCEELAVLDTFFTGNEFIDKGRLKNHIQFWGVDVDEDSVKDAINYHSPYVDYPTRVLPDHLHFIAGDARSLDQMAELPAEVDVAFFRHPRHNGNDHLDDGAVLRWRKIFEQALNKLSKNGIMVFTMYLEVERDLLLKMLSSLPVNITVNKKNNFTEEVYFEEEVVADSYVVVVKKDPGDNQAVERSLM